MNKRLKSQHIIAACLASWTFYLLLIVSPGLATGNAVLAFLTLVMPVLAVVLTITSLVLIAKGLPARDTRQDQPSQHTKLVAALLCIAIATSIYAALKSFGYSPLDSDFGNKFAYENIATGAGFVAIVLTFVLSALQKDIYWPTKKRQKGLDERQVQARRHVFEVSYKVGIVVAIAIAWVFLKMAHYIPSLLANSHNSIPGSLNWLALDMVLTFFAMPLIIAAWRE